MIKNLRGWLADEMFDAGIVQFGGFKLALHENDPDAPLSPIYFNLRLFQSLPDLRPNLAKLLAAKLTEDGVECDLIARIPLAFCTPVSDLSLLLGKPMITPRSETKTHGISNNIDGIYTPGQVVLVCDDLVTKAGTKLKNIKLLEGEGLCVKDVLTLIDREQGGTDELASAGYANHSVYGQTELMDHYLAKKLITPQMYQKVIDYLAA